MQKILMLKTAAGPRGSFDSGKVYLVEDDLAAAFVEAGAAELLDSPAAAPAPEPVIETAVPVQEVVEQAVEPRPRGRRKASK